MEGVRGLFWVCPFLVGFCWFVHCVCVSFLDHLFYLTEVPYDTKLIFFLSISSSVHGSQGPECLV